MKGKKTTKNVSLHAKISDTPFDQKFSWPPEVDDLRWRRQTDRQAHRQISRLYDCENLVMKRETPVRKSSYLRKNTSLSEKVYFGNFIVYRVANFFFWFFLHTFRLQSVFGSIFCVRVWKWESLRVIKCEATSIYIYNTLLDTLWQEECSGGGRRQDFETENVRIWECRNIRMLECEAGSLKYFHNELCKRMPDYEIFRV